METVTRETTLPSNVYNVTEQATIPNFSLNVAKISGYTGCVVAFINMLLLVFIVRMIFRKKNSFHTQLMFVAFGDTFGGLSIFIVSQIAVRDYASLVACAIFFKVVYATTCMSHANVLCICFQRYVFSRCIGQSVPKWTNFHVFTLISVNALFSIAAFVATWQEVQMIDFGNQSQPCSPYTLKIGTSLDLIAYCVTALMTIVPADVLCLLTIRTLLKGNKVQPASEATIYTNSGTISNDVVQINIRNKQQQAINTVLGLLIVLTLFNLPIVVAAFLKYVGVNVLGPQLRLCFLLSYVTHIANPFFIIFRTRDLRSRFKEDALQMWSTIVGNSRNN